MGGGRLRERLLDLRHALQLFLQPLLHLLDTMVDKTILKAQNRGLLLDDPDPGSLLDRLEATTVVHEPKWIGEELT